MPTTITAQNGTTTTQNTHINVTGCPPTITVTKAQATASRVIVTVKTTATGTIRISGVGLAAKRKKSAKAGTSKLTVTLTDAGRAMHARHQRLRLHATLTTGTHAATKTTTIKL
jgi:hypothetical protein